MKVKRLVALAALLALAVGLVPGGAQAHTFPPRKYVGSVDAALFLFHFFENCEGDHIVGNSVGGIGGACWDIPAGHRTGTARITVTDASGLRVPYLITQRNGNAEVARADACGNSSSFPVVPSTTRIDIWMIGAANFALSRCAAAPPGTAGLPTTGTATLIMSA